MLSLQILQTINTIIFCAPDDIYYSEEYYDESKLNVHPHDLNFFTHASTNMGVIFNIDKELLRATTGPIIYGRVPEYGTEFFLMNPQALPPHITIPTNLINKQFKYIAQDKQGQWYLYALIPTLGHNVWDVNGDDDCPSQEASALLDIPLDPLGWELSLHKRTKNGWERTPIDYPDYLDGLDDD